MATATVTRAASAAAGTIVPAPINLRKATQAITNIGRLLRPPKTALVVSAGKMDRTVKVKLWGERWEKRVSKSFRTHTYELCHDPNNSVREGDVVAVSSGWRTSKDKRHIVRYIIAPYGVAIHERPPVPTDEELVEAENARLRDRLAKKTRRAKESAEATAITKAALSARKLIKESVTLAKITEHALEAKVKAGKISPLNTSTDVD